MNKEIPIARYFISMLLLWACYLLFIGNRITYWILILYTFLSYGIINVAYSRKVKRRNAVAWLACLWVIPFPFFTSLLVASIMAMFGKTEDDNEYSVLRERPMVAVPSKTEITNESTGIKKIIFINRGVTRLCLVTGLLLSCISLIEINGRSGLGQIICGKYKECFLFGEPDVVVVIVVFIIPFIIAKIIEFIIKGFTNNTEQK